MKSIVVGEFQQTGINEIDIDLVKKKWNHLWYISEWRGDKGPEYRLIKYKRKDSANVDIKLTISKLQAIELIIRFDLVEEKSPVFKSGSSWRREADIKFLEEYRKNKSKK